MLSRNIELKRLMRNAGNKTWCYLSFIPFSFRCPSHKTLFISSRAFFNNLSNTNTNKSKTVSFEKSIEETKSQGYHYSYSFNKESLHYSNPQELLTIITMLLNSSNKNPDNWYNVLNKLNDLLCEQKLSKDDVIEFLKALNHFQPKILEKSHNIEKATQIDSNNLFTKEHEDEYFRLRRPGDFFTQFTLFLRKNLKANVVKHVMDEAIRLPYEKEGANEKWDDLLGIYDIVFDNFEKKVIDDVRNGRANYSYQDCIKLIQCFSRAENGTNMLFEVLMRKVAKNIELLSIEEVEILLNYLPHDLFNEDGFVIEEEIVENKFVETGKTLEIDIFYKHIFSILANEICNTKDEMFINLWQGILKIKFVNTNVVNMFIKNFEFRIKKEDKEKKFFFDFLQIFAYFLKVKEEFVEVVELPKLYNSIEDPFIKKNLSKFNLKEISTVFWVFHHFKLIDKTKIQLFEPSIKYILLSYLNDPKSKIETMGYESNLRYYDNYNIEKHDLEMLNYFIKASNYSGDLLNMMDKALKSIELEDTHPISRKWFFF